MISPQQKSGICSLTQDHVHNLSGIPAAKPQATHGIAPLFPCVTEPPFYWTSPRVAAIRAREDQARPSLCGASSQISRTGDQRNGWGRLVQTRHPGFLSD
ncbi:hypothetical protein PoB_005245600 [Plakobranchus ocellatus]|uniref:Uncharacterized protein n=1 Tax=Plakobranchus ocellatus TaxID=259542 RepID=A0AAV4C3I4_9GAST|nr:hypothetical protein PoB_005245600 [Plakobranchus ocellatus]